MFVEEIISMTFIGAIASILTYLVIDEGRNSLYMLLFTLEGIMVGWLSSYIWIILTDGLGIIPMGILYSALFSIFVATSTFFILRYKNILSKPRWNVNKKPAIFAFAIMILLLFSLMYTFIPQTGKTITPSSQPEYLTERLTVKNVETKISSQNMNTITPLSYTANFPVDIDTDVSSVSGLTIAENPSETNYLKWKTTFAVSNVPWQQPYVTMIVIKDSDNDKKISQGDTVWKNKNYKYPLNQDGNWIANIQYEKTGSLKIEDGQAVYYNTGKEPIPCLHAEPSTRIDDSSKTLDNTPENYTPPRDMLSWIGEKKQENIKNYISIPTGEKTSIKGKLYCPVGSTGRHFIHTVAYDQRFEDPLASKTISFEINAEKPDVDITYSNLAVGTATALGLLGTAFAVTKYGYGGI